MKSKLLLASLIFLMGCDPLGRLTGNSTKPEDHQTQFSHPAVSSYDGSLSGANFVTIDADGAKDISVYIKRDGDWVLLGGFDPAHKKDPYYLIEKNTVVFMNTTVDDEYSIRVTK